MDDDAWILFKDTLPPTRNVEIIVSNMVTNEEFLTTANKIWTEIDYEERFEWKWRLL